MKNSNSPDHELQEAITRHIEQVSAAKEDAALEGYPFQVLFAANADDDVKITVRWPTDASPAQSVYTVATMLHHISAGHWRPPMVSAVKKQGIDSGQPEISGEVIREWGQATQIQMSDNICVSPRQVFARNNPQG